MNPWIDTVNTSLRRRERETADPSTVRLRRFGRDDKRCGRFGISYSLFPAFLLLALLAAVPTLAPAQETQQAQPWKNIPIPTLPAFHPQQPKRIVLDNGAIIFLQEDHELPFINGFIEMRGGGRDLPASKTGMVSLYGDVWRTSGTATISGDAMDDLLEAKAAKVETDGDVDSTSVSWSCLKTDFNTVFGLTTDLLLHPKFDPGKLDLAKQQIATGIVRRNDDVGDIASREAAKLVYGPTNPYGRIPELAQVMSITIADLEQFHTRTVIPNGMIIGVSGDFDAAAMEQQLRAAFGGLKKGTPLPPAKDRFNGPTPGVYSVDKNDVDQSNIWIVGLGTERSNPDYYALSVMNQIFSGGFDSRLFQNVRTRLGLAYSVGGAYGASYDHPGLFYTVAATKSASTVDTTKAMLDQIDDLKTEPFTDDELRRAKDELLNSFIFRYDTPDKVLTERATLEFYGYPADFLEKYRAAIEKVTTADLERVAKKYVDRSKLAVLVVGNVSQINTGSPGQPGKPLSELGTVHPIDITIPMPPGMQGGPGSN
ncbi:MAG TPA: pitrilysin family protein [Acidobacteriaceae bacterium]|nr:pitrilysin family protein [Acidobacteriaceae bacterium]